MTSENPSRSTSTINTTTPSGLIRNSRGSQSSAVGEVREEGPVRDRKVPEGRTSDRDHEIHVTDHRLLTTTGGRARRAITFFAHPVRLVLQLHQQTGMADDRAILDDEGAEVEG